MPRFWSASVMSKHVIVSDRSHDQIKAYADELGRERGRPVSFAEVIEYWHDCVTELRRLLAAEQDGGA
jgi:hypothetical protein